MDLSFLTVAEFDFVIGGVAFVAGVLLSTKIKDAVKGVPSDLRAALSNAEANTVARVKAAQAEVIATLPKLPAAKVALPPAPTAPTPIAPAPVLVPVPEPAPAPLPAAV